MALKWKKSNQTQFDPEYADFSDMTHEEMYAIIKRMHERKSDKPDKSKLAQWDPEYADFSDMTHEEMYAILKRMHERKPEVYDYNK
jgi:predicted phosphoribosyltransferase